MTDRPSDRAIAQALQWATEKLDRRGPGETIALAAAVALIWHKARKFDASAAPPEPAPTNPPEIGSKSVVEPGAEHWWKAIGEWGRDPVAGGIELDHNLAWIEQRARELAQEGE